MPRAPKTSTDTPKPHARRKPRPRFEVAPEQVAAPAAAWVYRDAEPVTEPSPQAVSCSSEGYFCPETDQVSSGMPLEEYELLVNMEGWSKSNGETQSTAIAEKSPTEKTTS